MSDSIGNYETIRVQPHHGGQIVTIKLASPPGNVLEARMMAEICGCLDTLGQDRNLKALVFEGEGKHFCFGASVPEHVKEKAPEMISAFHGMFKKLLALKIPTIAVVRGQCLGGGMELASFCSFIIAEPSAKFGQPEIQLAVFPPVAALILPRIIGQLRADDLVLTGRTIDATTAREWGLVHTVADDAAKALDEFVEQHILPKSALSLKFACRAVRNGWYKNLESELDEMEDLYVNQLMDTFDANEGIGAFLEKRAPEWRNQ